MVYARYIELRTMVIYGYLFVNQQTSLGGTTLYSINYYYYKKTMWIAVLILW